MQWALSYSKMHLLKPIFIPLDFPKKTFIRILIYLKPSCSRYFVAQSDWFCFLWSLKRKQLFEYEQDLDKKKTHFFFFLKHVLLFRYALSFQTVSSCCLPLKKRKRHSWYFYGAAFKLIVLQKKIKFLAYISRQPLKRWSRNRPETK